MDRLTYLMGLMVACPYHDAINDCPFRKFRNSPIDKLIRKSSSMEFQESMQLIELHKTCFQKRKQLLKAG